MTILELESVSKAFKRFASDRRRVIEMLSLGLIDAHEKNWVLKDISFTISAGESVAIIGENGAGKSTLLSIIVGARAPTSGSVATHCRMSALLELGMGFNSELTGRGNAITGLQLLGIPNHEILPLVQNVLDFSELGDYFEEPLRTYSSGMQVRLAFSVATVIQPELLIVDEALSVGDAYFQHKSMARIRELSGAGTALLFVSHDPSAVKSLCSRAILLDSGRIAKQGNPEAVLNYYNALIALKEEKSDIHSLIESNNDSTRSGNKRVELESVHLEVEGERRDAVIVGDSAILVLSFTCREEVSNPTVGFCIRDRLGNEVFGTNTYHLGITCSVKPNGRTLVEFMFPVNLGAGSYSVTVAAHKDISHISENYDWWDNALVFQVIPGDQPLFEGTSYLPVQARLGERHD